ncbi:MAG TPA: hypothetical protein VFP65_03165 [Anaeromyxobacteraceae bacterium]|nr:hypothetical protein [Anaeromyxobacteraceae bacterium]
MILSLVIRFLHITAAAAWLGAALYWPGALKRGLAAGTPGPAVALARTGVGLDLGLGLGLLATGLLYASPLGGAVLRTGIFVGLALSVARVLLVLVLARPGVRRAAEAAAAGRLDEARAAARPVAAYAGMAHLLWLLALAAMVFPV